MLPLHTRARVRGIRHRTIAKVLMEEEAIKSHWDPASCLIWVDSGRREVPAARKWLGVVAPLESPGESGIVVDRIESQGVVAPGDVIRLAPDSARLDVLYRRGANGNTLLATERCNSFCVMCSQPPRQADDGWLVDEMLETIPLVDPDEQQLGISGGEPTLLGDRLIEVMHQARRFLPETGLHILTNGRRFADRTFAQVMGSVRHPRLAWGIPLHSDCPEIHDYIAQSRSAWRETAEGLHNLARHGANIELRIVVQRANVERLGELASFIFRNLTFVRHVAFMGLEPIGFARTNFNDIWVDPADCASPLRDAVFFLANRGMNVSVYNFQRCVLPSELWPFARQSISDWKNRFLPDCAGCMETENCCGFFKSVGSRWIGRDFGPIRPETERVAELHLKEVGAL